MMSQVIEANPTPANCRRDQPVGPTAPRGRGRVLMICCAFPPTGGPGVQRSAKFAKYLADFGWRPTVWAARKLNGLPRDESLLADLPPDLDVRRYPSGDPHDTARVQHDRGRTGAVFGRAAWANLLARGSRRSPRASWPLPMPPAGRPIAHGRLPHPSASLSTPARATQWHNAIDWRLDRLTMALMKRMVPDPMVFWALRSYAGLRRIIEEEQIDVIYSTFSPPSNHLLAWLLKRRTGRPWVADFRDLWTDDYVYEGGRWRRWIDRWLEDRFLASADAVVAVTDRQRDILSAHLSDHRDKFVTVSNGVDAADFDGLDRERIRETMRGADHRFVLVFTGWFLSNRVDRGLIEGVAHFADWMRKRGERFEFRVVGAISEWMKASFADCGVDLVTTGYLPHDRAVEHTVSADVLLLPAPSGRNGHSLIPAKVFEYLAAGSPILVVGPPNGEGQRIVERCQAGICVDSEPQAVCSALQRLWRRWKADPRPQGCPPEKLTPYARKELTRRLADLFNQVARVASPTTDD